MTTPLVDDKNVIEIWEITTGGTVWVWTRDVRQPGHMQKTRVGGKAGGSKRLRITRDERRYNEEQVIEEMTDHNVFRNGSLKLISSEDGSKAEDVDTTYHLDTADLLALLEVKDEELFRSEVEALQSELILRRLFMIAEKNATVAQLDTVRDVVEERYGRGHTQQSIREQDTPGYRGTPLS
jgi:hypothetical protein